jgi:hypothetical protein
MPAVESQMLPLGTQAPAFTLPDPDGTLHSLQGDAINSNDVNTHPADHPRHIKWMAGNKPEYF